ncbi:MAG TPA: glycosyltransferase [Ilumatobacteraceae bacterium]|nr:glycosyltransferase [Ilumatobacteraceae bacterium]
MVVSALDERADLDRNLRAIGRAAHAIRTDAEVVVVVPSDECPQGRLAASSHANVVTTGRSSVAAARNAGARVTTGQILVTIDADRVMSPVAFAEIERLLATGCYVGGGATQRSERRSVAIDIAMAVSKLTQYFNGLGGGMYWSLRKDFEAIGGFDERVTVIDDLDFARRLRDHGLRSGRKFINLRQAPVTTSCRRGPLDRNAYASSR